MALLSSNFGYITAFTKTVTGVVSRTNRHQYTNLSHRLLSLTSFKAEQFPPNSSLDVQFIHNRNPRNLEKLRIAAKPQGWYLETSGRCFWNKVTLETTSKHVTAKLQHFEGLVPVTASTREWCINKFLYSTKDTAAVEAVSRVFAQRCIESGIIEVFCDYSEEDRKKEKLNVFLTALEEAGIALKEPDEIEARTHLNAPRLPDKPWEVIEDSQEAVKSSASESNAVPGSSKRKQ